MNALSPFLIFRFAAIVVSAFSLSTVADAGLIFSGDFQAGTGNLEITDPITFTLTLDGTSEGNFIIVFDNIVTPDAARNIGVPDTNFAFSRNGNPVTATSSRFFDNQLDNINDLTLGDGFIDGQLNSGLVIGDSLTLLAGNYAFGAASGFNPQYNGLTFTGSVFVASSLNGLRISSIENAGSAVPEPGSLTLFGVALAAFVGRRRRWRVL